MVTLIVSVLQRLIYTTAAAAADCCGAENYKISYLFGNTTIRLSLMRQTHVV